MKSTTAVLGDTHHGAGSHKVLRPESSPAPVGKRRIGAVDAARGCAMFFVFLAHSPELQLSADQDAVAWLGKVGMIASPMFMLISGAMLGYLYGRNVAGFPALRITLVDKALVLLTAAHFLLALSWYLGEASFVDAMRVIFITDAIGFSLLVGIVIVPLLPGRARLLLAAAVFLFAWGLIAFWHPQGGTGTVLKHTLVGTYRVSFWYGSFPLLTWLAVYLVGTVIGQRMGRTTSASMVRDWAGHFARIGCSAIIMALTVYGLVILFADRGVITSQFVIDSLDLFQKNPTSPVYLLFYGGWAILIMGGVFYLSELRLMRSVTNTLAVVGRTSLFVYVLQAYVFFVLMGYLSRVTILDWVVQVVFGVGLIVVVARWWDRSNGNRFITVGLKRAAERRKSRNLARADDLVATQAEGRPLSARYEGRLRRSAQSSPLAR